MIWFIFLLKKLVIKKRIKAKADEKEMILSKEISKKLLNTKSLKTVSK